MYLESNQEIFTAESRPSEQERSFHLQGKSGNVKRSAPTVGLWTPQPEDHRGGLTAATGWLGRPPTHACRDKDDASYTL